MVETLIRIKRIKSGNRNIDAMVREFHGDTKHILSRHKRVRPCDPNLHSAAWRISPRDYRRIAGSSHADWYPGRFAGQLRRISNERIGVGVHLHAPIRYGGTRVIEVASTKTNLIDGTVVPADFYSQGAVV